MTRISAVFILTLLSVLGVVGALLLPSAAQADCAQWDLSGHWVIQQGNGIFVYVDLTQTGTDVRGTGTWGEKPTKRGSITGTIDANGNILLNADWGGVYRGGVGSDEIPGGSTFAVNDPGNQVGWRGDRAATCQVVAEPNATTPESHAPNYQPGEIAGQILKGKHGQFLPPAQPPAGGGGGEFPTTPPQGTMATVIADVDVYKLPGGQDKDKIGILYSNNKTTKVSLIPPCENNWCHVKGAPVPTGEGFVYSGTPPDFQSLQF